MPKQLQASLTGGEISSSLWARTDLARWSTSLKTCRNFFVRPTGGVSNRAGLEFVYALDATSEAALIPFIFSSEQAYMLVFQEESVKVFADGAYVDNTSPATITNITRTHSLHDIYTVTTSAPHGFSDGDYVTIAGVIDTFDVEVNGVWQIDVLSATTFFYIITGSHAHIGSYTSGGTATGPVALTTPYQSEDLASLRFTQSADVVTIVNQLYTPYEFVRIGATSFTFSAIDDFEGGPFLDENVTATTVTASAATGVVTLTASTAIFTSDHIGSIFKIRMEDLSGLLKWEPNKLVAASGVDPDTAPATRLSEGKFYSASGNAAAPSGGTFTGLNAPSHDEGIENDGDGSELAGVANSRTGVKWQYVHSLFGIAEITAIGGGGTTATATALSYIPVVSPATTVNWSFGAWSEEQGYPALVTYYQDRLVFANTPGAPQTEWASKTGDYHNFSTSSPQVEDDSIRQALNARQINEIVELLPMDQLIALTASSSWASPKRGEAWTPLTIGYDPQSFDGAAFIRGILTGDSALFVQNGATKVRDLLYKTDSDKFSGDELTILARHLFDNEHTIVDMDYAKEPHGILWIVRSDGALIGLTYLKEQEVIGWHRHDTDGFFEHVCVIPEDGVDTPYFVVRRTINGSTVRYLERMAVRDVTNILDAFHVDCGLSYDGRNTTATTMTISGASYNGGDTVSITSSAAIFGTVDGIVDPVDSVLQFPVSAEDSDDGEATMVRVTIDSYSSSTDAVGTLNSPAPTSVQNVATTDWRAAVDNISGLLHLEGKTVTACCDGAPETDLVVESGAITLSAPAAVVHVGLPYISEIETLDINVFGSSPTQTIKDNSKLVSKVIAQTENTIGLTAGSSEDAMYEIGLKTTDFDLNLPWEEQSEVAPCYITTSYTKSGSVILRQSNPLPATILSITPEFEVGENG